MIDPNAYPGASRPALKPETIGYPKVNAAVLTIADVDPDVELPEEDGGSRKVLTLTFKEYPDVTYYTNKTSRETLIAKLGLNEKKWVGERVPLVVVPVNNPKTKRQQMGLWVADADTWAQHLNATRKRK